MADTATFVYVSNADSREIRVLKMDPQSGALTAVESVGVSGTVMPLAVSPDRRFLYAGLRSKPFSVASFAIDPLTGKLTHLATRPLADSMPYITTDRSGRYLLCASYHGDKITVSPIDERGVVKRTLQVVWTEPHAHAILPDPSNRFVLATSLGGDVVMQFRFDASTGKLSSNEPPSVRVSDGAGPRHFRFHPNGRFVYLLNQLDASVYVFGFDAATGTLAAQQITSALPPGFAGEPSAADIHLTPDGRFLYASERASNTLAAFRVDAADGTLTPIGHFATEDGPRGFAIDPAGRFLYVAGQSSNRMTRCSIDRLTGQLTELEHYPMGANPNWIE
ncbi:MAG: lactonase family protein, partial [Luteimonas sp.]